MKIENVWQEYRAKLKAFLHTKVSNPADVDDLLQEILIKTHQHLGTLRAKDKLKPWLYALADNVIIDFYRQQGRQRSYSKEELWYEENPLLIQQEMSECIEPIIKALPQEVSDLLVAIDLQGRSQKVLALELGVSYSALKSRVQRGRLQLRSVFESCCDLELDRHGNVIDYQTKAGACDRC